MLFVTVRNTVESTWTVLSVQFSWKRSDSKHTIASKSTMFFLWIFQTRVSSLLISNQTKNVPISWKTKIKKYCQPSTISNTILVNIYWTLRQILTQCYVFIVAYFDKNRAQRWENIQKTNKNLAKKLLKSAKLTGIATNCLGRICSSVQLQIINLVM